LTDKEIIDKYRLNADKHWVGMLYERYAHLVLGLCFKYMKDKELAEDMVCEIFISLFDKLLQHDVDSFKPWLYITSRNHCLMQLRKSKRTNSTELNGNEVDEGLNSLEIKSLQEEKLQLLEAKLEGLKKEQAECLSLFYLKGFTYDQVGDKLGMEVKAVKSHIQNGKRNLKLLLIQHEEFNGN
jgi:RNA polymerase sigma-70 factor (ECF subfamily)